jgi:hypothetical protein
MSVDDKRLVAAFFLPGAEDATAADLLAQIGATDIAEPPPDSSDPSGLVDCRWAGLAAKGFLDSRLGLHLLCVFFFQSSFLDLVPGRDDPPSEDHSDRFVDAFAQACDALCPIVALVVTHLHEADIDALWALAPAVLEWSVPDLVDTRLRGL